MRTGPQNPNPKPKKDLGETSGKNLVDRLVRPGQEFPKSMTETSIKVQEPNIYDEAINDRIYGNRW